MFFEISGICFRLILISATLNFSQHDVAAAITRHKQMVRRDARVQHQRNPIIVHCNLPMAF